MIMLLKNMYQTFKNRQVKVCERGWGGFVEVVMCLRMYCIHNFSPFPSRYLTSILLKFHPKYWLMIYSCFLPWDLCVEHCVEFQRINGSLNVTSENATSPVIEFWE